jgi:hypothetical protein
VFGTTYEFCLRLKAGPTPGATRPAPAPGAAPECKPGCSPARSRSGARSCCTASSRSVAARPASTLFDAFPRSPVHLPAPICPSSPVLLLPSYLPSSPRPLEVPADAPCGRAPFGGRTSGLTVASRLTNPCRRRSQNVARTPSPRAHAPVAARSRL